MGLIDSLRRTLQPRLADLIRQDQALLERAIGGVPYRLVDEDKDQCMIIADDFTVTFTWMWRERWIDAEIEVNNVVHPLDPYAKFSARSWLEALGLPILPRRSGDMSPLLLRDELESLREVVANVLSSDRALRKALFFLAGQIEGYNDRVVVPEQLPPRAIQIWSEARYCRKLPEPK